MSLIMMPYRYITLFCIFSHISSQIPLLCRMFGRLSARWTFLIVSKDFCCCFIYLFTARDANVFVLNHKVTVCLSEVIHFWSLCLCTFCLSVLSWPSSSLMMMYDCVFLICSTERPRSISHCKNY